MKDCSGIGYGLFTIFVNYDHPSGNLNPSEADKELTSQIKQAGKLLDIQVIDHLILGINDDYTSFMEKGWL